MIRSFIIAIFGLVLCAASAQADTFDKLTCNSDIPKALTGKSFGSSTETAMQFEAHHKAIGLKDNWADIVNDDLQTVSLTICGREYHLLVDGKNVIRDVIPFPAHSRAAPGFGGTCRLNGKEAPWALTGVLSKAGSGTSDVPPTFAYRVDEKTAKFISVPVKGLLCPRSGIFTADGGP